LISIHDPDPVEFHSHFSLGLDSTAQFSDFYLAAQVAGKSIHPSKLLLTTHPDLYPLHAAVVVYEVPSTGAVAQV
jgi:hypothetical protein